MLDRPGPPDRLERGAIGRRDRSLVALRRGGPFCADQEMAMAARTLLAVVPLLLLMACGPAFAKQTTSFISEACWRGLPARRWIGAMVEAGMGRERSYAG